MKQTQNTMPQQIQFRLDIIPPKTTSQTKRLVMIGGKPRFFPKKEHQTAENDLLLLCAKYAPVKPLEGPLELKVHFCFPWRKSEKKKVMERGWAYNDTRPDCDNLVKLVGDVLTKMMFYRDDGQVAMLNVIKYWSGKPNIVISITELEPMTPEPQ